MTDVLIGLGTNVMHESFDLRLQHELITEAPSDGSGMRMCPCFRLPKAVLSAPPPTTKTPASVSYQSFPNLVFGAPPSSPLNRLSCYRAKVQASPYPPHFLSLHQSLGKQSSAVIAHIRSKFLFVVSLVPAFVTQTRLMQQSESSSST